MSRKRRVEGPGRDAKAPAAPQAKAPDVGDSLWRRFGLCLVPAIVAIVLYLPTLRYPFIGYDDTLLIVENQEFLRDLTNLPRAFAQDAWQVPGRPSSRAYYRPLYTVSFMLDAQLGGASATAYHITNLALHALAAALVFLFLRKLDAPRHPALLLSILFAVHPALTSVVAWVPGRNDSLLALFSLPALMALVAFAETGRTRDAARHLCFFGLALLTKEAAIALPFIAIAYLVAIRGESPFSRRSRMLAVGWATILLAYALARGAALEGSPAAVGTAQLLGNLTQNAAVLVHYAGKALVPVQLALLPAPQDATPALGLVTLGALGVALRFSARARRGHVLFGSAVFATFLVPTLVVPVLVGLEQRLYLPLVGVAIVLLEIDAIRGLLPGSLGSRIAIVLAVAFALKAAGRFGGYEGREAFWRRAVQDAPHSSLSRVSLCAALLDQGRLEEADAQCRAALEINQEEPVANNNLGVIRGRRGQPKEALPFFERETRVNPAYADGWFNKGVAQMALSDPTGARASWERALALDPGHQRARRALQAPAAPTP